MKILLINPNTSEFVTEKVAMEARRIAGPQTEIIPMTGRNGSPIVSCRAESALAAVEAMSLAVEHDGSYDAIVLAISFDSGLLPLRELLSVPVVGMSEAAMLTACTLGGRFALVTFGDRAGPVYEEMCRSYGLGARLSEVILLPQLTNEELRDPLLILPRLVAAIEKSVAEKGTESVILAGAVFAGITDAVGAKVDVPVLNGVAEAVGLAETLVRLAPKKARRGSFQRPAPKAIKSTDSELVRFFSGT